MSDDDPVLHDDDEMLTDSRGRASQPVEVPLPPRWQELRDWILVRSSRHQHDPAVPMHKVGRFDAIIYRGHGAYGMVIEAIDPDLQRRVALKLCQVHDDETVDDVLAEARHLAKLNHPNVITIHETGRYDDDVFFVMEYATGGTVERFVNENDPPWQEVLDIYMGAGAGLAAAHEAGIVHGDFKPTNVLVDEGGVRPRVADFGFARIQLEHMSEHEREATQARRGTLAYAAPEVLRGEVADALSDQWSFCASFWESLEGVLPFNAKTVPGMLATIDRLKPWWINESVPQSLRDVLERGLSIDRDERYPSMAELLRALEVVRQAAPPPSEEDRLQVVADPVKRRRRKGPGWGPFAIAVLVASASTVTAVAQWRSSSAARPGVGVALVVPGPRPSTSECALTRAEKDHPVLPVVDAVCKTIRSGDVEGAAKLWRREHNDRLQEASMSRDLAIDALIVARTFVSQAETFLWDGKHDDAAATRHHAVEWSTQAASTLGNEHAGVCLVRVREKLVKALVQPQHSTTPLPSKLP